MIRSARWLLALVALVGLVSFGQTLVRAQDEGDDDQNPYGLTDDQKKEYARLERIDKKAQELIQAESWKEAADEYKKISDKADASKLPEPIKKYFLVDSHYNRACCLARQGEKAEALKEFVTSVEVGYWDWKHIGVDKDVDSIREEKAFKEAIEKGKATETEKLVAAIKSGKSAFDVKFESTAIDGKKVSLADLKGKAVILSLFRADRPDEDIFTTGPWLQKLSAAWKEKGLEVVGVGIHAPNKDLLKEIAEKHGIKFAMAPIANDDELLKTALKNGSVNLEFVIFIDKDGKVRAGVDSVNQYETFEAGVKALLEGAK